MLFSHALAERQALQTAARDRIYPVVSLLAAAFATWKADTVAVSKRLHLPICESASYQSLHSVRNVSSSTTAFWLLVGPVRARGHKTYTDQTPAVHLPHVDYRTERVQQIVEDGVIDEDGKLIKADIIIAATGYQAQQYFMPLEVTGQHGRVLQDHMGQAGLGLSSYKGTVRLPALDSERLKLTASCSSMQAFQTLRRCMVPILAQGTPALSSRKNVKSI